VKKKILDPVKKKFWSRFRRDRDHFAHLYRGHIVVKSEEKQQGVAIASE
jgi:hypothetical protein